MADLFDTLRDPVDDPTAIPPPEQIRRRGDRLRRRRVALLTVAAASAVAVVATGGVLATGLLGDDPVSSGPAAGPTTRPTASPAGGPSADVVTTIPTSFPLDVGIEDLGTDGDLSGPGPDVRPLVDLPICGSRGYSGPETASDEFGLIAAMPQFVRTRYLTVHPDAETATAAARDLVGTYEGCPTFVSEDGGTTTTTTVTPGDLGTGSWTVTQTFETEEWGPMLGQEVVQVILADEALLVSWTSSEGPGATDAERLAQSVAEDAAALGPVVAEVCDLVEADCD